MEKDTKNILQDYENSKTLNLDFTSKSKALIIDLLSNEDIKFHQITDRVKEKNKLEGKIFKKNHKYCSLNEITDICGVRIITYFDDEVERIGKIIGEEFEIDLENSIDKRQLDDDQFGYRSLHYVVSLSKERLKLSEYKRFKDLKFELQIRTILQHSWAEIEHDIGYKGEIAIPQFAKRTFYRVAALLETADLEFVKLKNILSEYEYNLPSEIINTPETVTLDQASLSSFIHSNAKVKEIDNNISEYCSAPFDNNFANIEDELLGVLKNAGIKTIKELDECVQKNAAKMFEIFKEKNPDPDDISGLAHGVALFQIRFIN